MDFDEYIHVVIDFIRKGGEQINLIGGEPLLHPELKKIVSLNRSLGIKTTIYTNGTFLNKYSKEDFAGAKLRISLYCKSGGVKSLDNLPKTDLPIEVCFMVSKKTSVEELCAAAEHLEKEYNCKVFFISSIRELDNPRKEFFDDTDMTMSVLKYKELVHGFLERYSGNMEIHISKRGVFESTMIVADNRCRFANYFIGRKIIQCPYDIINRRFQEDYDFNRRFCQQNNSCLMSKIILKRKGNIDEEKI